MVRVKFIKYRQNQFLKEIMADTGLNSKQAAKLCNVCTRTFRDWKRGKYQISYTALSRLCKISHIPIPKNIEILPEFWSTKKAGTLGGKRRFELYGPLGSIESRRKGGINSSRQFSLNPEWAKEKGFVVRKEIKHPDKSSLLAEFIGIMIGDGSVRNDHQITISFNGEKDQHHASHIQLMVRILFDISSSKYIRKEKGAADIVVTGKNLIEFLEDLGIRKGNKVVNQINIPGWIFECRAYQIACLRGLFDTDESIYPHNYTVGAKRYRYIKDVFF